MEQIVDTDAKKKWDVVVELDEGAIMFDPKTGASETTSVTRVKYRPQGKRGRFETFVLQGGVPKGVTIFEVVERYDAELRKAAR